LTLKFGLDLATLSLVAMIAGSASIIILSEVVKRVFKSNVPTPVEPPRETGQAPSYVTESKRNFKISFGDRSYVITVEELPEESPLRPETARPPGKVEPAPTVVSEDQDIRVVKAPLPGVVLSIKRQPGDQVSIGSVLLTLEAMKMENEITAPVSGLVKRIMVREGQTVEHGQVLVELSD
jgi:biotin carboxyl carrier protein